MKKYRNHVKACPLPPCHSARFEVDDQPGYPHGRTVSLNLELFDKDGNRVQDWGALARKYARSWGEIEKRKNDKAKGGNRNSYTLNAGNEDTYTLH